MITTLIRIDPMNSLNKIITKDNFIRSVKLNKDLEIDCNLNQLERENTEPNNGFWLSKVTKDGTSCTWRDYTQQEIKCMTERMIELEQNYDKWVAEGKILILPNECAENNNWATYIDDWTNPRKVTYTLKHDTNLLHLTEAKMMLQYKMQGPTTNCYINWRQRHYEELKIVNDFIESNKLDTTITESNKTLRGINVVYDHNEFSSITKFASVTRAKCGGSKIDMMKSCNALLEKINKDIEYIDKCEKKRFCIDWDKIRDDGFDGVVFYDYPNEGSNDEDDEMVCFLDKWSPDTVIVWNWCFEDNIDISQY